MRRLNDPNDSIAKAIRIIAAGDIFGERPFAALADLLRQDVEFCSAVVVMRDGPDYFRVFALSGPGLLPHVRVGVRLPANPEVQAAVYGRGERFVCRAIDPSRAAERVLDQAGERAYACVPMQNDRGVTIADLIITFRDAEQLDRADFDLLSELASVLGLGVEAALSHAKNKRWAKVAETSRDAMLAWDVAGLITDANPAAQRLLELRAEDFGERRIDELVADLHVDSAGGPMPLTFVAGGREVTAEVTVTRVEGDATVAAHAVFRDVSDVVEAQRQVETEAARRRGLEERHNALLDNAPLIIFQLDPETGALQYVNRYAEQLLGHPSKDASTLLRDAFLDAESEASFDEAMVSARLGVPSPQYEAHLRRADGSTVTVSGTLYPTLGEGGEVVGIEGVLADISSEHAARTRLVQTDRLSTLGMLAAAVAHEINNPAAFILLGLNLLSRSLDSVDLPDRPRADVTTMLRELRDSIQRIVDIARDLKLFASAPDVVGRRSIIDVVSTVESALTLTRGSILDRAELVHRHDDDVPPVVMDQGRLSQVLVNLLVNAGQAIPRDDTTADHKVEIRTRSNGRIVHIEVTDTGVGIPPDVVARIWTPFFTTKGPELGTGLGLSISKDIVERAGGALAVESPPRGMSRGSRFTITLPAAGRGEQLTPMTAPLAEIPQERSRVLVVEDEEALARVLVSQLSEVHDVVVAHNGVEALDHIRRDCFAAILCDLRMPEMGGERLFEEVRGVSPEALHRFIFMTGVGFGAEAEEFLARTKRPVLHKPFSMDAAFERIAKVILANRSRKRARAKSDPGS